MKIKFLSLLFIALFFSSCAQDSEYVGSDSTFFDDTFREIPTHDSIDCFGSCSVKIYNR